MLPSPIVSDAFSKESEGDRTVRHGKQKGGGGKYNNETKNAYDSRGVESGVRSGEEREEQLDDISGSDLLRSFCSVWVRRFSLYMKIVNRRQQKRRGKTLRENFRRISSSIERMLDK